MSGMTDEEFDNTIDLYTKANPALLIQPKTPEEETQERLNAFIAENEKPAFPQIRKIDITESVSPRKFIYNKHFIKGVVTGTSATGGTGKTSMHDVEVVGMGLGRDLLNAGAPLKAGAQKVLVLSLEDDESEYIRRHKAISSFYRLTDEDIKKARENIYPVFDDTGELKIAYEYDKKLIRNTAAIEYINRLIDEHSIDVLTIDPLISIHEADENANKEMQVVLSVLRSIARTKDVAVHYLHHNRKGGGTSADDMRGAVALKDGSRVLRMISKMTEQEATELSIPAEEAVYLIGTCNGKNNFAPLGIHKTWFRTNSVCLNNATDIYDTDYVAVVSSYKLPGLFDGISFEDCHRAWLTIKALPQEKMRANNQAADWLGNQIADDIGLDNEIDKVRIGNILNMWVKGGVIKRTKIEDKKKRKVPLYEFIKLPDTDDSIYTTF